MLVCPVVVKHQMDIQSGIHGLVDAFEELQEFLVSVPGMALADNSSIENIESGECVVVPCRR
jgi:hypothetical protein